MIIPIRCYTCGKVTGNKWEPYRKMLTEGVSEEKTLDSLGLIRTCCRSMLTTHVNIIDKLLKHEQNLADVGTLENKFNCLNTTDK